jgi:hypothetical protein
MLRTIRIQIIDNPMHWVLLDGEDFTEPAKNRHIADELRDDMKRSYPSVVSVEYIDLFADAKDEFREIREMIYHGGVNTPIVLMNGVVKVAGAIPPDVIKKEVEKMLSSGPLH